VQDVLQADWHDVWHSPQPPFSALFFSVAPFNVFMCFIRITPVEKPPIKSGSLFSSFLLPRRKDGTYQAAQNARDNDPNPAIHDAGVIKDSADEKKRQKEYGGNRKSHKQRHRLVFSGRHNRPEKHAHKTAGDNHAIHGPLVNSAGQYGGGKNRQ